MIERFQKYFKMLEGLSTNELDQSIDKLVRAEKRSTALVIAHLSEMSRRKGALERGYKNLFDYGVRRLNLSEGSVALRLQVANVSRRFPQILVALAENRISLTVAGLLAPHLNDENVDKLLGDCAGVTKRAAEEYVVAIRPKPVFAPSVRRIPAPLPQVPQAPPIPQPPARKIANILQPATPDEYNFRFAGGKEFKQKLERLAEVLGVENPMKHMAEILEQAVDLALDKKDPMRRLERRRRRAAKLSAPPPDRKSRPDEILADGNPSPSRYISSEVRERVHERAGYQCEFEGPGRTRCRSRTGLEIEHTRPFGIHHSHDERFLRLYCAAHNRLSAERVYGKAFMQKKIAATRALPPIMVGTKQGVSV